MSQQYPSYGPQGPQFQPPPPKKHTIRNVVIGVTVGFFLLIGGCTALLGGSLSQVDEPSGYKTAEPSTKPTVVTPTTTEPTTTQPSVTQPPATSEPPAKPALTVTQEQAVGTAQDYLETSHFSRKGLIEQLEFEGFTTKDATFAVDYLKVDWYDQAVKVAQDYLETSHFSRSGLIDQLEFEGFTAKQAAYGVKKAGL